MGRSRSSSSFAVLRHATFLTALAVLPAAEAAAQARPVAKDVAAAPAVSPALYQGLRYRHVGPFRGGRVTTVTGSPAPDQARTFYFGSTGGGVWKTTDAGQSWTNVGDGYIGASHSCTSETYTGPSEASEPEIQNELWIADTFPNIKFSNNIHSFGGYFMWAPGTYLPDRGEGLLGQVRSVEDDQGHRRGEHMFLGAGGGTVEVDNGPTGSEFRRHSTRWARRGYSCRPCPPPTRRPWRAPRYCCRSGRLRQCPRHRS